LQRSRALFLWQQSTQQQQQARHFMFRGFSGHFRQKNLKMLRVPSPREQQPGGSVGLLSSLNPNADILRLKCSEAFARVMQQQKKKKEDALKKKKTKTRAKKKKEMEAEEEEAAAAEEKEEFFFFFVFFAPFFL
jgi:hypothetical protein